MRQQVSGAEMVNDTKIEQRFFLLLGDFLTLPVVLCSSNITHIEYISKGDKQEKIS